MKLENQVCPRKQGNDLRALGITNALFYWMRNTADEWVVHRPHEPAFPDEYADDWAPAFTVAELGVMLPPQYTSYKISEYGKQFVDGNFWMVETDYNNECEVCTESSTKNLPDTAATTEAETRAAMLIVLLETGKITAEEVNQRLSNS